MFKKTKVIMLSCYLLFFLFISIGSVTCFFYYLNAKKSNLINIDQLINNPDRFSLKKKNKHISYAQIPDTIVKAYLTEYDPKYFQMSCLSIFFDNLNAKMKRKSGIAAGDIYYQFSRLILSNSSSPSLHRPEFQLLGFGLSIESCFKFSIEIILEINLNNLYFGRGAYGIFDAAKVYLGKDIQDINLDNAIALIALLKAPKN